MKGICCDITLILGNSAGYHENRSQIAWYAHTGPESILPLIAFNVTNISRISISFYSFEYLATTLDSRCENKTSISLVQIMNKRSDTVQKKQGQTGWGHQIHGEYLQTQDLVSLIKSISNFRILFWNLKEA